ncbi:MAG: GntR family transcriptional regulator [Suipraeoptans sp.]
MSESNQRPREEAIETLENYILGQSLKPGDRLPSERLMCDMWDLNRSTLRSAIKQLILEGKLYSKTGSGTFVAKKRLVRNLQDSEGFYSTVEKANRKVETEVLEMCLCETSKRLGKKMKLPLGHKLIKLTRLRYLDDIPVMYETVFLDAVWFKGIENFDFSRLSLYQVIKDNYNVEAYKGSEKISIAACNETEAKYLQVEVGAPAICQSGITMDENERTIEYFKSITLSEYVSFGSELRRR